MKIDKLYTLSQFVDYLESLTLKEFCAEFGCHINITDMEWSASCYKLTKQYNDFLKQPLTKEMFVNEIEKPDMKSVLKEDWESHPNYDKLKAWQEAEKKVIFEGFELINRSLLNSDYEQLDIVIYKDGSLTVSTNYEEPFISGLLLSDLAEKTNGQLKLKNVEI